MVQPQIANPLSVSDWSDARLILYEFLKSRGQSALLQCLPLSKGE